jgi:hypothetical protein
MKTFFKYYRCSKFNIGSGDICVGQEGGSLYYLGENFPNDSFILSTNRYYRKRLRGKRYA